MDVTFSTESIATEAELEVLAQNLGVTDNLVDALRKVALVAMADFLDMATGRAREKLSTEAYQKRLEYMVLYYYTDRIPREDEVARVFQVTPTRAKGLLMNVQSIRRLAIGRQRRATIIAALQTVDRNPVGAEKIVTLSIASATIARAIEDTIASVAIGEGYGALIKVPGTVDRYKMSALTFNKVAAVFGVAEIA